MASQVLQVYYVQDPTDTAFYNVVKKLPRDWCDVENENGNEDDPVLHDIQCGYGIGNQVSDVVWYRDDVPATQILFPPSIEETAS